MSTGRHIPAVDDEPEMLAFCADLPGGEGHRVSTRRHAGRGLDAIAALAPDLIMLDHRWSVGDAGRPLPRPLKATPKIAAVPIVHCTTAARGAAALAGGLAEMRVGVVRKPFDLQELLDKVARGSAGGWGAPGGWRDDVAKSHKLPRPLPARGGRRGPGQPRDGAAVTT